MPVPLADVQRRIRDAVVSGMVISAASLLAGGSDPSKRLAIHRRHYEVSLVAALMKRFAATTWLVGTAIVEEAAKQFVKAHPPCGPCIAEYGDGFPGFLAVRPGTARMAYLREFADLDWHLGRLAVSIDLPAITRHDCESLPPDALADVVIAVQPGTFYLHADWPIDELMTLYLTNTAPERMTLVETKVWLEVRGAHGAFRFSRLAAAEFAFRVALSRGKPVRMAAQRAWRHDTAFDPGAALVSLVDAGLVTSIDSRPYTRCRS